MNLAEMHGLKGASYATTVLERMRKAVRADGGTGTDGEIDFWLNAIARTEGVLLSPEVALTLAAMSQLLEGGRIKPGATVVCVNTATGLRYPHLLEAQASREQELRSA